MATRADTTAGSVGRDKTLAQKLALLWGATFLLVGVLGFIPGITSNFDDIAFAGKDSDAELLGLFQVSVLHNIVHALFGVGILMSRTWEAAKNYLLGSAIVYVILLIYGLITDQNDDANFVPMNSGDDWLHLGLALGLLASYLVSRRDRDTSYDRNATVRA